MAAPRPWHEVSPAALAAVAGVLTDIDDTLTRDGAIEPVALRALQALHDAGVPAIAVTGRPAGWSEPFVQAWPVRAIVAENGGVLLRRDGTGVRRDFTTSDTTRAAHAARLAACAAEVLAQVPGATRARDSAGRLTDIAIDHAEFGHLGEPAIARVVALMQAAGLTATVSSIHINGWLGTHDKWSGACWAVQAVLGRTLADEAGRWVYVGDSPNDQAMFQRFALSVGVANLQTFASRLVHWPAYLAAGERGHGFAEVASALLAAK